MAAPIDAGSIYSDVRVRLDKLNGDLKAVNTGFDKLGKQLRTNSDKTTKTQTENFKKFELAGVAAIGAVTLAFKKSVSVFAETEQSLANVEAVSNATAAQFAELEEAAANAGTTTRFTAGQAADALFFLSSAGLDATQSVEALDGVLQLAGATGSDLAQSAQAVTSTLSQFGLEASQAADVSNVFAAANSNSQATLDKLQNSLRQVGPVASGLGISLEETVGSLQALFNAGFQGEAAGRALKSALADLANEASPTIAKLEALGVSFDSVNPEAVGLTSAIGALEDAGLSTAQVIDAFGKVAGPQLVTLIKTGEDALKDYEKAVTGTDEAARQYAVQNDTLAGSIDALKSAIEGTSNSFVETLAPVFRAIIDLAAGLLRIINKVPGILKGAGAGAGVAAGGFLALSKALGLVGITLSIGPLAVVAGIGAAAVGLVTLANKIKEVRNQRLSEEFGDIARELGLAGQAIDEFTKKAGKIEGAFRILASDGVPADLERTKGLVKELSEELGLTEEEIIKIGVSASKINDSYKEQLKTLEQINTEAELLGSTDEAYLTTQQKIEILQKQRLKAAREEARAAAEAEEIERQRIEKANRLEEIKGRLLTLDELATKGALSEADALEEKKSLREEQLTLLLDEALLSGTVSDQVVAAIKKQQDAIDGYSERLEVLDEQKAESAETEKENVDDVTEYSQQQYLDYYENYKKGLDSFKVDTNALTDDLKANWLSYYNSIGQVAGDLFSSLVALRKANADAEIREIERVRDADLEAVDVRTNALLESLGLQEETKIQSLERQLAAAIEEGDKETEEELQQELTRTQILQNAEDEKAEIEKDAAEESAKLKYNAEIAAWNFSKASAAFTGAETALKAYGALAAIPVIGPALGVAAAIAVGITTAANIATINKNKPQMPQLQTGGIVLPQSSGTAAVLAENGSPELALNAGSEGEALLQQFGAKVAQAGAAGGSFVFQLYMDGRKQAESVVRYINNGIVKVEV